ncbi:MAG TPA: GTP 3',8-cyclase MoaA [Chroococcales cyanobacterium]|jgi:cyclic pyranopterin phosphate synthase
MLDQFGRNIDYLRIAVTDRCNFRCRYCMPTAGIPLMERKEILHYGEIADLVKKVMLPLGIAKVRLTGGEPLIRKDIVRLVERLSDLPDLSLTTNGSLLEELALPLKKAGLRRVNVSIDSLDRERFSFLTRGGELEKVLRGIDAALAAGLDPVKINVVLIPGVNGGDWMDFARLTLEKRVHVRFIEFMPLGDPQYYADRSFLPLAEIKGKIEDSFGLEEAVISGNGPAKIFMIPGALGTIGLIDPMSHAFCGKCNRLRLTADGKLKPCLMHAEEVDLKTPFREGASPSELQELVREVLAKKPIGYPETIEQARSMSQIGG